METHSGELHECDQCEKKYKSRTAMLRHKRTAHAEAGQSECVKCGKNFPHKKALNDHQRAHSDRKFECPVCGKKVRPGCSARHMKIHAGQACECDVCGKVSRNQPALDLHKQRAHSKAKHQCERCGKVFGLASTLRKHAVTHDEEREEYRCVRCPRTFKSPEGRKKHMEIEHSGSRFTCDSECGLHSATRSEYLQHLTSHHVKQHPATCKCVSVDSNRAQKIATNLGNTAFVKADGTMKCIDGDCVFATTCARQMETHKEQSHHDAYQPVLRCSTCETWFSDPSSLKYHDADKLQGERRFKCGACGYITNNKGTFTRHQTSCQQGKALGNNRVKSAESTTGNLEVKKESPYAVYQFGSEIGEGGFGKVYEAVKKGEVPPVKNAIKENLMALIEYYELKEKGRLTRFIVMECCRPGSLTTMQKLLRFQFEEPHVLYVLKEVACGLEHIHSAGVIHRDLKSANVLVNERAEVKIADFGVSTDERIAFNCRGTPGLLPQEEGRERVLRGTQLQRIENDRHLKLSEAFKKLVSRCLEPMTTRLSAAAIQKVPAVKKACVEPFKLLVEECLKKQKEKEEKRSARRRKPTTDTEAFSLFSSPTPTSGVASKSAAASSPSTSSAIREQQPSTSSGTSSLFSAPAQRSQQATMSTGMSSYFSAAPASTRNGHSTANTAVSSLFPASEAHSQQASTPGGMSSLFFSTASSGPDQ
ncbi:Protein kinase [Aphelenchoides avenae]|nr:Protein kinase [Aphelenchus avenae]